MRLLNKRLLRGLSAIVIVGGVMCAAAPAAEAAPLVLDVQPIQICDDGGTNCANGAMQLFEDITNKIWAQAEIVINFLTWTTVNNTGLLNSNDFGDYTAGTGGVVNLYFANNMTDCGGYYPTGLFGCASVNGLRTVINEAVFTYNGGIGRLDTIAHELGHNLGLGHDDFGAGGADNVLSSGSVRTIPTSIDDINPDGAKVDKLTQAQIDQARQSDFLYEAVPVPEPGTLTLLALALAGLGLRRRDE